MRNRASVGWGMFLVLILACSSSEMSGPREDSLSIERGPAAFSRIELRDTLAFGATVDGRVVDPSDLAWKASNVVLRLIAPGVFVAESTGRVTVSAVTASGVEASTEVEVLDPLVASLRVPAGRLRLIRTETALILVTALDRKGHPVSGVRDQVRLSSTDPGVVAVAPDGVVTAVGVGEGRIVARLSDAKAEVAVTVRELPPLVLDQPEVRLRLTDERFVPTGTVEGEARPLVELRTVAEERWLHESPVVELRGDTVVAVGPGTATVEARAPVAFPDTLVVEVEPDGPTVFAVAGSGPYDGGDQLDFRGWGLDRPSVGSVTVGGLEAAVLLRDSATLRVSVPDQSPSACHGNARRAVEISGVLVLRGSGITVVRPDELTPAIGDPVAPEPGSCLKLPAAPEARWALALTDAEIWGVEDRRTPMEAMGQEVEVLISDLGGAAEGPPPVVANVHRRGGRTGFDDRTSELRTGPDDADGALLGSVSAADPWEVGDTLRLEEGGSSFPTAGLYRVREIVRDEYVIFFRESTPAVPDSVIDRVVAAMDTLDMILRPLLAPAVSTAPRDENGQYTVLVRWDPGQLGANGLAGPDGMWIQIQDRLGEPLHNVLLHEITHSYQRQVSSDEQAAGLSGGLGNQWAREGFADFMAAEVRRRVHQIPPDANLEIVESFGSPLEFIMSEAYQPGGSILFGYQFSMGLYRHLARRWMDATGASPDEALREIFVGSTLGWWGCHPSGSCSSRGLAERLTPALGADAHPIPALLDWALTQAADDRLPAEPWQNPFFRLASGADDHLLGENPTLGWNPHAVFVAGGGDRSFDMPVGGVAWIALGDTAAVGTTLRLPDDPRWRWRLMRVR